MLSILQCGSFFINTPKIFLRNENEILREAPADYFISNHSLLLIVYMTIHYLLIREKGNAIKRVDKDFDRIMATKHEQ